MNAILIIYNNIVKEGLIYKIIYVNFNNIY